MSKIKPPDLSDQRNYVRLRDSRRAVKYNRGGAVLVHLTAGIHALVCLQRAPELDVLLLQLVNLLVGLLKGLLRNIPFPLEFSLVLFCGCVQAVKLHLPLLHGFHVGLHLLVLFQFKGEGGNGLINPRFPGGPGGFNYCPVNFVFSEALAVDARPLTYALETYFKGK